MMASPGIESIEAQRLVGRLQGLRDSDRAVLDLIALGPIAVPTLRRFLFRRERSGIYEPRCQAVFALAALKAADILVEFLRASIEADIIDPVERTGEDAVINAAARALKTRRDDEVFCVLMAIARHRRLSGVIEALGEMRRPEALPYLVAGLSEDFTRREAETALRKFGAGADAALARVVLNPIPSARFESVSSLRTRRSALSVLREIGVTSEDWDSLRALMDERDGWLTSSACALALSSSPGFDQMEAMRRLIHLLRSADWLLTIEIESLLVEHQGLVARLIAEAGARPGAVADDVADPKVRQVLARVDARIREPNSARRPPPDIDSP